MLEFNKISCIEQQYQSNLVGAIDIARVVQAGEDSFTRKLLDESPNLVCVINEQKKLLYINKKFRIFFNLPADRTFVTIDELLNITHEITALTRWNEETYAEGGTYCMYECEINNVHSGEINYFKVQKTLFADEEKGLLELIIATDITEKHVAELALVKANAIVRESLKLKEQFISNMSHEIRTPLNAVIGFTDLLSTTNLSTTQLDYVETIKNAGQNLLAIINDILDLSKIETGNIQIATKPFDLFSCVNNIKKLFEPRAAEKGIYLNTKVSDSLPQFVCGDEIRLSQILINLISNACKFTGIGGVDIIVKPVRYVEDNKVLVQFVVKDTGIGIEKDKLDVIFIRYSQASEEIHRVYGGTGLGLSISKNLIELFGGEMHIESEVGKGSSFSFNLPLEISAQEVLRENLVGLIEDRRPYKNTPVKILLAEDNNTNAKLAIHILKRKNYIVDRVMDGLDVLKALENDTYHLILMDIQMITQNGIETTKMIRSSNSSFSNIPIIALTAHSFSGERDLCENAGMNGYISKPFSPEKLFETIDKTLFSNVGVD